MTTPNKKLAILCGGGPAPGINSVIGAATIRTILSGAEVIGLQDGFEWIMQGDISHITPLTIGLVSRLHFRGGSFIGISRANPTRKKEHLENAIISLLRLNVDKLITIGGDDTLFSAHMLEKQSKGRIRVVHVPKTIDNDVDLPKNISTFGYQTARHLGVELIKHLMVDAHTTHRWYFVVTMGRKAGHLALGIGKAAGATLTLIPEEFHKAKPTLALIVDTLVGAILKRLSYGRPDGVAVIAEGIVELLGKDEFETLINVERDAHDHIRLAEVNFGEILKFHVQERLKAFGIKATIVAKNIGYELRCADPIPFDMEYTRDLGYCAAQFLIEGGNGALICIDEGIFNAIPFDSVLDTTTGRTRVRMVNVDSTRYKIAHRYMIRLRRQDFDDPHELAKYAATAGMSLEDFQDQFRYVIDHESASIQLSEVREQAIVHKPSGAASKKRAPRKRSSAKKS